MYDSADQLFGIYQYLVSETEMPAPWVLTEKLNGVGKDVIDYEYWGLFVFFPGPGQGMRRESEGLKIYNPRVLKEASESCPHCSSMTLGLLS